MPEFLVRDQTERDGAVVRQLIEAAFRDAPHRCGREQDVMDALWAAGAATVALVAEVAGRCVGQIVFSPVTIGGQGTSWLGLGPVAVLPAWRRQGLGTALVDAGLRRLRAQGAAGAVLVGDPAFYGRFGFRAVPQLRVPGVPGEYLLGLAFDGEAPIGTLAFHAAFDLGQAAAPMCPEEALAMVALADRMDHFPAELSGGEQRRVAVARAIVKRPDALLCDEPTGALDVDTDKLVLAAIARANREVGSTTVVITHNAAIAGMADRVLRMGGGRIIATELNPHRRAPEELVW